MKVSDYIFHRTPDYDELILKDIRQTDYWVQKVVQDTRWWDVREIVRMISEGLAYRESDRCLAPEKVYKAFKPISW